MRVLAALALMTLGLAQPSDFDARVSEAMSLEHSANLTAALDRYKTLLSVAPDEAQRAEVLIAMALVENRVGDYASARVHSSEAAEVFRRRGNAAREASALNVAGLSELYAGDYHAALSRFQPAARLADAAGDVPGHAELLSNLGNAFFFLGRYDEAAHAYAAAMVVVERHRHESWAPRRERIVRLNQAALNQRLGRYQAALEMYRAEVSDARLRPDEQAQGLVNQGALFRRLGDPFKALAVYEEAQRLFERARHADGELGAMINRGIVFALDLDDLGAARRTFTEAVARAEIAGSQRELLHARLYRAEAELRAGDVSAAASGFEASLTAAAALQTPEESWKALYGLGRIARRRGESDEAARLLERAVAAIESLREELRLASVRADFFQEKREVYDALIDVRLGSAAAADLFDLMERARARAWRDRLGLSATVDLAAVQRVLEPGSVLLEYWSSPNGAALVRVSRDEARITRLPHVDEQTIARFRRDLAHPDRDWKAAAGALAAMLLPPGTIGADVARVIVVPDGVLSAVPFDTLSVEGEPLLARAAVSQLPTAAMLLRSSGSTSTAAVRAPWHSALTAFADPRYGRLEPANAEIPPLLPASAEEARAIAGELGGTARVYLGADNLKTQLVEPPDQRTPILHLATHALVQEPLERSRLLFSSPTGAGPPESLFVREIYDLDLHDVQLAVLSACDTEQGEFVRGEGVQSFSRALLAAGAGSTVTTLWRVPDQAPIGLMRVFYHRLQQGDRRDEALRQAKLAMLHSGDVRAHPHYWAAYVLTGETGPVSRALPWSRAAAAALFVLSLIVFALGRARSGHVSRTGRADQMRHDSPRH